MKLNSYTALQIFFSIYMKLYDKKYERSKELLFKVIKNDIFIISPCQIYKTQQLDSIANF